MVLINFTKWKEKRELIIYKSWEYKILIDSLSLEIGLRNEKVLARDHTTFCVCQSLNFISVLVLRISVRVWNLVTSSYAYFVQDIMLSTLWKLRWGWRKVTNKIQTPYGDGGSEGEEEVIREQKGNKENEVVWNDMKKTDL